MSSFGSDYSDYSSDFSDDFGAGDYSDSYHDDFENDILYVTDREIVIKEGDGYGIDFENGKITEESLEVLAAVRDVLLELPIRINVFPYSDFGPNSLKEAETVKRWLVKNGIQSSRIKTERPHHPADSFITIWAEDKSAPQVIHKGSLPVKETSKTRQA